MGDVIGVGEVEITIDNLWLLEPVFTTVYRFLFSVEQEGRELFDKSFKTYAERWAFRHPSPADFFRTMEDASGIDLDWFWRGWFFTNDHVDLALDNVQWFKINTKNPEVEADHTHCDFGQWLISASEDLAELKEFEDLIEPHRALHLVYQLFKDNPEQETLREEIIDISGKLINRIDSLEQRLKQLD